MGKVSHRTKHIGHFGDNFYGPNNSVTEGQNAVLT